jgi:hypothetical protein
VKLEPVIVKRSMVTPELRPALRRQPRLPLNRTLFRRLARALIRRMAPARVPGVTLEDAPGMRIHRPDTRSSDAALL